MRLIFKKAESLFYYLFKYWYYKLIFKHIGLSKVKKTLRLQGSNRIHIGNKVFIEKFAWLAADNRFGKGEIIIEDGTYIGNFAHIYSTGKIHINKKVLIADKVYIADNAHGYKLINVPIIDQPVEQLNEVQIDEGSWLGEHVCIIGASIGKHCVIGANSIVNKDIPDYSIAVGTPARVIKRYNFDTKLWQKTDSQGNFIE